MKKSLSVLGLVTGILMAVGAQAQMGSSGSPQGVPSISTVPNPAVGQTSQANSLGQLSPTGPTSLASPPAISLGETPSSDELDGRRAPSAFGTPSPESTPGVYDTFGVRRDPATYGTPAPLYTPEAQPTPEATP